LHNEDLHNFYCPSNVVSVVTLKTLWFRT